MKNIHVLSTDKPSRLYLNTQEYIFENKYSLSTDECQNKHIYITNSEEIKEGDWVLFESNNTIKKAVDSTFAIGVNNIRIHADADKKVLKIILTTDQDLIKYGVQAIPNEFLEWFVKNPSCERVDVKKIVNNAINTDSDIPTIPWSFYKIIIPKEEPKQKCECTDECLGYLTKECKRIEEPKQETRKEAVKKYGEKWDYFQHPDDAFEDGIEWLEKQLCNSEIIQRIRASKSDAEARRIIKSI